MHPLRSDQRGQGTELKAPLRLHTDSFTQGRKFTATRGLNTTSDQTPLNNKLLRGRGDKSLKFKLPTFMAA